MKPAERCRVLLDRGLVVTGALAAVLDRLELETEPARRPCCPPLREP